MGKLILLILISSTSILSLFRPWIGIVAIYFFVILTPQDIWWWHFDGIRPVYYIMVPTFIGFFASFLLGKIHLASVWNKVNLFLLILWIFFSLSYFFGPFVDLYSQYRFLSPEWVFSLINKIFVLYFIAAFCIDTRVKLNSLLIVLAIAVVYLTYWINNQYLFEGAYGRIGGPSGVSGNSIYADENAFGMFFVVGWPLLYYWGSYTKNLFFKLMLWSVIPFAWHAVFLTGSRGALLGIIVTLLVVFIRSKNKIFGLIIMFSFLIAFVWQAGDVMRNRAETINQYDTETSASTRLEAWDAALHMIYKHPINGVGIASFGAAFPFYSDKTPREAHNTILQISAESGIMAGLSYLCVVVILLKSLWKKQQPPLLENKTAGNTRQPMQYYINEFLLASIIGLCVCSLFLSLQVYELFYFLCLIANSQLYLQKQNR